MKTIKRIRKSRTNERGAALISTLLYSTLLLGAGGTLIVTTSMTTTTTIDSTAEMQAYYGAEAGLQSTLNTLRGNVWSSSSSPNVNFRRIVEPADSNATNDASTVARLSNWLNYADSSDASSLVVEGGQGPTIGYKVTARDADNSKVVTYSTSGVFTTTNTDTITLGAGVVATLQFYGQPPTILSAYPTQSGRSLGRFDLTVTLGVGAPLLTIPNDGSGPKIRLTITQTAPWAASDTFIGTLSGTVSSNNTQLQIDFQGATVKAGGANYTLAEDPLAIVSLSDGVTVTKPILGSITAPQPKRIVVQSTGYGPKGAKKTLEMVVSNNALGLDAPAMLTMRGADDCTAKMTFNTGSSGSKDYSGMDNAGAEGQLPTFAVSGCDADTTDNGIVKHDTVVDPEIGVLDNSPVPPGTNAETVGVGTPAFLATADNARAMLNGLQEIAESTGRYFQPDFGSSTTVSTATTGPNVLTFVDGNCTLDGGQGLLVVTGQLLMNGNPTFTGLVLVLGEGYVNRDGGGNGDFRGAMVVAKFARTGPGGFLAPYFNTNGSGISTMQYDSAAITRANRIAGNVVAGVREF